MRATSSPATARPSKSALAARDAQFESSPSATPVLARRRDLASGSLALNDGGDEIVLLDPSLGLADTLAYGDGDSASLGLTGTLFTTADYSLHRVPGFIFPAERDHRHRFLLAAPAPFASVESARSRPADQPGPGRWFAGGLGHARGAQQFYPWRSGPAPLRDSRTAASIGLDFVAIANPAPGTLGAWRWQGSTGDNAVVYGPSFATDGSSETFLAGLAFHNTHGPVERGQPARLLRRLWRWQRTIWLSPAGCRH